MSVRQDLLNRYLGWDLTQELREPNNEEADAHFNGLLARIVPILSAVGIGMTLLFWPLDVVIAPGSPERVQAFFRFRIVSLVVCGFMVATIRWVPAIRKRPLPATLFAVIGFNGASGWVLGSVYDLGAPIFWGLLMMVGFLLLAMPMRLAPRIIAHTGSLGAFAAAFFAGQGELMSHENFPIAVTMVISALFLSIALGNLLSSLSRRAFRQARELEAARAESERLLSSILPEAVAERLKRERGAIADQFDTSTVMFADLVGFTKMAGGKSAAETVALLNDVFSAFDELTAQHGLEKIKTIGDEYMVVGGVPVPRDDHAEAIADLALAMLERIKDIEADVPLQLRIGIHCGPVVAGVIGSQKFSYDVWGDTVNVASRMETYGAPGRIHVSDTVHEALADRFAFTERDTLDIKGKGQMRTWFLTRRAG